MKVFKKAISAVSVLALMSTVTACPLSAFAVTDSESKINSALAEKLEAMDDGDSVDVSVWFNDISETTLESRVEAEIKSKISDGELDESATDVLEISEAEELNDDVLNAIKQTDSKTSVEEVNEIISEKRAIAADMYTESNSKNLSAFLSDEEQDEDVIYMSHYAPNVLMTLTKAEIYSLCESDTVEKIYAYDREAESMANLENFATKEAASAEATSTSSAYEFTTSQYETTGIAEMRDTFGFTGTDVKIGIIDYPFAISSEVDYFKDDTRQLFYCYPSGLTDTYSSHGNCVSCIIAGYYNDESTGSSFVGAVPDAKLYMTAGIDYRNALEVLLDNGVTVINGSLIFGGDENNTYSDTAKWLDHIVSQHNVTYVGAAGNEGSSGIGSGQMAYNSITVGATDTNGEIASYSSYNNVTNSTRKPDLVAPGGAFALPATRDSSTETPNAASGTSFAAPVVTGAIAQLSQASPTLASNPRLMKAVILAGCSLNSYMTESDFVTSTTTVANKMSQVYGAGMLNVLNSYALFSSRGNYFSGTINSSTSSFTTTMTVNADSGKLVRVCAVWDKGNSISGTHSSDTVASNDVEAFLLQVTTPDGITYSAYNSYDTKAMTSFISSGSGTYTIKLVRGSVAYSTSTSYGIAVSVQNHD